MVSNRKARRRGFAARKGDLARKPRPDGFYHGLITLALALPITSVTLVIFGPVPGMCALLGCIAQLVVDPDLDQPSVTAAEWRMLKLPVIGRVVGSVWVGWSTLYSMVINHRNGSRVFKHRGISHWPVIGTLTRLVFFFGPILIAYTVISGRGLDLPAEVWAPFVGAMMLCDIGHWARDQLT